MTVILSAEPEPVEIDTTTTAILVVDMQNAFAIPGGYFAITGHDLTATQRIMEPCRQITCTARQKGIKIIYLQMAYSPDLSDAGAEGSPAWRKSRGLAFISQHPELRDKLQVMGTWGAAIIPELEPQPGDLVIRKTRYDGFWGTNLDIVLHTYNIRHLIFIGTATNICIESTLRHAFFLDYFPILVSDATTQSGPDSLQAATVANVRSNFGWVTTSQMLLDALAGLPHP